ncbi:MAG: hypothetical protein GXO10_02465 [Crenarchaeota archaeon]|nr:hypothetical protein [Thermoproteota archaeon]
MSIVQKSIPFPPTRLEKIVNYLLYIKDKPVSVQELKERKVDFGRGRGDITRFLSQIGLIEIENSKVRLSRLGKVLVEFVRDNRPSIMFKILFNNYMIDRVLTYRILIDTLRDIGRARFEDLYTIVNDVLKKTSPSLWINKVAYRSLVTLALDLEIVEKRSNILIYVDHSYRVKSVVELSMFSYDNITYIDIERLQDLLGFPSRDVLLRVLEDRLIKVRSPSAVELYRVRNIEELVGKLCRLTVIEVMKFSSTDHGEDGSHI